MPADDHCLSCRLINGIACVSVAAYLGFLAKQMKGYNQLGLILIGGCFGAVGFARLVDFNPFKKKNRA